MRKNFGSGYRRSSSVGLRFQSLAMIELVQINCQRENIDRCSSDFCRC